LYTRSILKNILITCSLVKGLLYTNIEFEQTYMQTDYIQKKLTD